MKNTVLSLLILLCVFSSANLFAQSQEDIEQLIDNQEVKKKKKSDKKEVAIVAVDSLTLQSDLQDESADVPINLFNEATSPLKTDQDSNLMILDESLSALKFKTLKKEGDALAANGSYYNAINYYNVAIAKTSKKKKLNYLNYQAGQAAFNIRDYALSSAYYKYVHENDKKNKYALATYQLANSLKHLAKYEEAEELYRMFQKDEEGNKKVDFELNRARLEIKGCKYALDLQVAEPIYSLKNPGENINGPFADSGPEIRGKELIFSKISANNMGEFKEECFSKLYLSEGNHGEYINAQKFAANLNLEGKYIGNPSFSKDGKTIYFSVCERSANLETNCSIYSSVLQAGVWINPTPLDANINEPNTSSSYPQIVIDEHGQEQLFFVAEREKGRGGKDIWVAEKNAEGSFDPAKNLAYPINTKYDELSPFYHSPSQTLYYSTNGEISLGGFDVYSSTKDEKGEWSEPANMETPVNSSLDDYDFILNDKGDLGYLVSNRVGTTTLKNETCCDDIFELRSTEILAYLEAMVYAEIQDERTILTMVDLLLQNLDSKDFESFEFNGTKTFIQLDTEVDYRLVAIKNDFDDVSLNFSTKGMQQSDTFHYDLFFVSKKFAEGKIIGTVYYEFSNSNLTSEAPKTLADVVNFLKENPNLKVEVAAHTDGRGTEEYNLNLSEQRSKAAANYLIFEGIAKDRIINSWFGESMPIEPNENEDSSDNPEGRALNRRTEFKIKL